MHRPSTKISRRELLLYSGAATLCPVSSYAAPRRIKWRDLIPSGTPYADIVSQGVYDAAKDIWIPEFDANGGVLNTSLEGEDIILAGYIIPLELSNAGVSEFVLVPFVGACIHVPPPPPNQLVFVTTDVPWPQGNLWDAVLVTGKLQLNIQRTEVAQVGYEITAQYIEQYRR